MSLLNFLKKPKLLEGMDAEKRVRFHIIEGGAHMFSKKHDVIAMEYLRQFAG